MFIFFHREVHKNIVDFNEHFILFFKIGKQLLYY